MLRTLCLLLLSATLAYGQASTPTVTVATLNDLLARAPRANETVEVLRGYNGQDWGGSRLFTQTPSSALATNVAHVFAITNTYGAQGQYLSADRTNSIQDIRWWRGGPTAADNTPPLTNAANYVYNLGGGYVKAGGGTHTFLYGGIVMPSGVRLRGDGPNATAFDFTSATPFYDYEPVISWVGTVDNTVKLHSVPTAGDRSIVLSSSVAWANGDWIQLSDTNEFSFGSRNYYHQGEFNFVYSNTGGTNIALLEPLEAAYPTATTTLNRITPTVGSAEGIHFALGTKSGAVLLRYADSRSYLRNCAAAGTEESHFWIDSSYGVTADGLTVDWDSDPSVGLNYGLVYGDSEYLVIQNCFLRSARHGISSGGSSIPTRYCRIVNSTFGSTRQNVAGADMHGDTVESTYDGCTFLSGLTLGGGRNRLLNSTILNSRGYTGVGVGECYYYDWEVRGNRFLISSFDDEAQSVWAMRFRLQEGNQSGVPASTNYWPGTWGGTSGQTIKILDNEIQFSGVRTNGNYVLYIDESTTLTANTNITAADFGGVFIRGNRIIPAPDQAFAQLTAPGIYIETRDKVRFGVVDISDNPFISGSGTQIRIHSGRVVFNRNTIVDQNTREGVYIIPLSTPASAVDVDAIDNLFLRPIGSAITVSGTTGRVRYEGNRVFNHGSINDSLSRFALAASDGSASVSSIQLSRNLVTSTNSPSYDVYASTVAGTLRDEWTETGGSVTTGTRSAGGGYTRAPFTAGTYGSTNAITLLGQYTALPTASSYPPGLVHFAGDLWYSDGASWQAIQRASTNFHNLRATNGLVGKDLIAETATLGADWPGSKQAVAGILPLFIRRDTNAFVRAQLYNMDTGNSAAGSWESLAAGAHGRFLALSTNAASANDKARVGIHAVTGSGIQFDLAYAGSQDVVFTAASSDFARLNTTTLSVPALTTSAATNNLLYVLGTTFDPSATRRDVYSMTLANLKNAMGTSSSTNLDNLTVTNTVRFGGDFYVTGGVGGTNKFQVTSAEVTSYTPVWLYHDFVVASGHDVYSLSTNFFNLGIKQFYPGYSDYAWLTSVGFKNATPLRAANILDSTTIDWTTTSTTNVTPSIKSQSLSTNLIDSTFYSLLMMTNGGSGSTTTNYLDRTLFYSRGQVVVGTTNALQSLVTGIPAHLSKTISAGSITTNFALHVTAGGTLTSTNDNWSNNKFTVKVGGLSIVHTITDDTSGVSLTDAPWDIDCHVTVTATGTNATVYAASVLRFRYDDGVVVTYPWVFTFPGVVSGTLDTTGSVEVDVLYSMDTSGQEINVKCNSVVATVQGAEVLTSGGGGSSSPASLVSVNGTTNNWNFTDSTPAAPNYGVNTKRQTSSTNTSSFVPFGPIANSIAAAGITNSTSTNLLASLTIPSLQNDGDAFYATFNLTPFNNTGSSQTPIYPIYVAGKACGEYGYTMGNNTVRDPVEFYIRGVRQSATQFKVFIQFEQHRGGFTGSSPPYIATGNAQVYSFSSIVTNSITWSATTNKLDLNAYLGAASTNLYVILQDARIEAK